MVHTPDLLEVMREGHSPVPTQSLNQKVIIMAKQIESVSQAVNQFTAHLKGAAGAIDKSHVALAWALINSVNEQDLSALDVLRGKVVEYWPTLVSRFDDYICASLTPVSRQGNVFVACPADEKVADVGEYTFALSEHARLAVCWNVKKRLAKDPAATKPYDIRADITRAINKLAKVIEGKKAGVEAMQGTQGQQIADVLKRAQADVEAIYAGTYKAKAKPAKATEPVNVVTIQKSA